MRLKMDYPALMRGSYYVHHSSFAICDGMITVIVDNKRLDTTSKIWSFPSILPRGHVWKLLRALYGLFQVPRACLHQLKDSVYKLGFRVSPFDPCPAQVM
jgi:hypothetical protein